jgi:hypothetical protein
MTSSSSRLSEAPLIVVDGVTVWRPEDQEDPLIKIEVGGSVHVRKASEWHALAVASFALSETTPVGTCPKCGKTPPFPGGTRCQDLQCPLINWSSDKRSEGMNKTQEAAVEQARRQFGEVRPDAVAWSGNVDGLTALLEENKRLKELADRQMNDAEQARLELATLKASIAPSHGGERLTPDWCMDAFWRANPGRNAVVPSLYLLDFAREVLRAFAPSASGERWIPADTPPTNENLVLVAYRPGVHARPDGTIRKRTWLISVARYAGGAWRFVMQSQKSRLSERVKFWQPLPSAPTESRSKE